jgi:glucose/arabinose dehydrogenase
MSFLTQLRHSSRRWSARVTAALIASALVVPLAVFGPIAPAAAADPYAFKAVVSGLSQPVQVSPFPDRSGRVAVLEKRGSVRVVRNGTLAATPYLSLAGRITTEASGNTERGLLGLAFGPGFATKPRIYVTYVRQDGAIVLSRFRPSSAAAATVSASTEEVLFALPHPRFSNHNGGALEFGTDGLLYISTGDGGGAGDPRDQARRLTTRLGKILRIDVSRACGSIRYCIPPNNPFVKSSTNRREIFASGFRNPWRMSIDKATGVLWVGDVGQDRREEVNRIRTTSSGWGNYGWPCREGDVVYDSSRCASSTAFKSPVLTYCQPGASGCPADRSGASVIGGEVYRGSQHPSLVAKYVFGDFISGRVWALSSGRMLPIASLPLVTDISSDANGELLAVSYSGTMYRLGRP